MAYKKSNIKIAENSHQMADYGRNGDIYVKVDEYLAYSNICDDSDRLYFTYQWLVLSFLVPNHADLNWSRTTPSKHMRDWRSRSMHS
jgi:hypothetical protein